MDLTAGWVKAAALASGLDHLGSQAPCAQVYSQLLPGITNVTNRARYYSLYPWLVWSLDRRGLAHDEGQFVANFRRAECLLTLIAERHARVTDHDDEVHGATMTGRDALLPALGALENGEELLLSTYATLDPVTTRYFKNRMGGLGQYYLGQFQELELLDGASRPGWVLCSREKAEPLARALDARVEGDLFFKTIVEDRVSLKRLDALQDLCPCRLRDPSKERELLIDLFFDRRAEDAVGGAARKRSLLMLLHWIDTNGRQAAEDPAVVAYRRSLYALDAAGRSKHWQVPDPLVTTARAWRTYERNDLLSVAVQAMFFTALQRLGMEGARCANAREFQGWFLGDAAVQMACKQLGGGRWAGVRDAFVKRAPRRDAWSDEQHEVKLRDLILARYRDGGDAGEAAAIYEAAARLLMLLEARDEPAVDPYADCPLPPNYDVDYPITLRSLRQAAGQIWPPLRTREVLGWIVTEWGLKTHLLVALRKFHQQPTKSTFKILPTDAGLELQNNDVRPTPTAPRLNQALQILGDLNLVRATGDAGVALSAEGRRVLEHGLAH